MEDFKEKFRSNARVEEIINKIIDHHDGAIKNVTLGLGGYKPEMMLDKDLTLEKSGMNTAGEYTILYDYEPVSYPLLTTSV